MASVPKIPANPLEALQLVREVKSSFDMYVKTVQSETTRREEIRAKSDAVIAHVEAQREVLLRYLELAHDSRRDYYSKAFSSLDEALKRGDLETAGKLIDSITATAKTTPFADLKDVGQVKGIWDGEIEV